jgi:hypothetical protein
MHKTNFLHDRHHTILRLHRPLDKVLMHQINSKNQVHIDLQVLTIHQFHNNIQAGTKYRNF